MYQLDKRGIETKYTWDFGEFNFDYLILPEKKMEHEEVVLFERKTIKIGRISSSPIQRTTHIFLQIYYIRTNGQLWPITKKTKKYHLFEKTKEGGRFQITNMSNNSAYSVISPSYLDMAINDDMLDEKNANILTGLKETDNPIVVKYYFNE